ncbi:MAG: hypothetical protein C0501_10505 [Isosphaera sp.]|nr:hypothetical protein [Isosphaera sp.]
MTRFWGGSVGVVLLAVLAGPAAAQPPIPGGPRQPQRPAFSPYLNLFRPGASVTQNYFGLVRPEIQARQAIQDLNRNVLMNQEMIQSLDDSITGLSELPQTGFVPQFGARGPFSTGGGPYFSTGPGSGGPVGGLAAGRGPAVQPVNTVAGPLVGAGSVPGAGGRLLRPVNTLSRPAGAPRP